MANRIHNYLYYKSVCKDIAFDHERGIQNGDGAKLRLHRNVNIVQLTEFCIKISNFCA